MSCSFGCWHGSAFRSASHSTSIHIRASISFFLFRTEGLKPIVPNKALAEKRPLSKYQSSQLHAWAVILVMFVQQAVLCALNLYTYIFSTWCVFASIHCVVSGAFSHAGTRPRPSKSQEGYGTRGVSLTYPIAFSLSDLQYFESLFFRLDLA